MKKALFTVLLILFAGFFGWRFFWPDSTASGPGSVPREGRRAVPVEVTDIRQDTISDIAQFTGSIRPSSRFVISPKISGRLEELRVDIGDRVENGDLVAVLDSEEYALSVTQAEAELEVSRANQKDAESALEIASRELERTRELRAQQVASEAELDTANAKYNAARASHEVARANVQQRQAALEAARVRLSYTRIHARWSNGDDYRVVSEKFIDEGNMLRANDPVVSIVDINTVIARINVIERDFPEIRIGQPATVTTDAYPGRTFDGFVVRRAPVLAEESRQALVEIEIPNKERLLAPGMYMRTRIEFAKKPDATVIPVSAIVNRGGRKGVFLSDEAGLTVAFVPIETGITQGGRAEVTAPDISGRVVTLGQHLLEDGAKIRISQTITELDN